MRKVFFYKIVEFVRLMRVALIIILFMVPSQLCAYDPVPEGAAGSLKCSSTNASHVLASSLNTEYLSELDGLGLLKIKLPTVVDKRHFQSLTMSVGKAEHTAFIVPVSVDISKDSVIALIYLTVEQSKISTFNVVYNILDSVTPCRFSYDFKIEV